MRKSFLLGPVVGLACWLAGAATTSQKATEAGHSMDEFSMEDMMAAMPQPTAEHKQLHERVGVWDAAFKMDMGGPEPMTSTAKMTYESFGPFWIVGRYEGDMMGQPFSGMEISGYDPEMKKYVSYWLDTTSSEFSSMHGTWNAEKSQMKMTSDEPQMCHLNGQMETMIETVDVMGADKFVMKMRPESMSTATMEITYTRRK